MQLKLEDTTMYILNRGRHSTIQIGSQVQSEIDSYFSFTLF